MLGDIVRQSTFPEAELERERQVILHEYTEDEDDALSTAFKLFDKACYGNHAVARPVIGSRTNIRRFTRAELAAYVEQQYTGANVVVGIAGNVDPDHVVADASAAFGDMPRGSDNRVAAPDYLGGIRSRRMPGQNQAHVVLGFPIPGLLGEHQGAVVAAALFGEGMSAALESSRCRPNPLARWLPRRVQPGPGPSTSFSAATERSTPGSPEMWLCATHSMSPEPGRATRAPIPPAACSSLSPAGISRKPAEWRLRSSI